MGSNDLFFLLFLCLFNCSFSRLKITTNKLKVNNVNKNQERQINNTKISAYMKNLFINFKENVNDLLNETYETEHFIEATGLNNLISFIFQ